MWSNIISLEIILNDLNSKTHKMKKIILLLSMISIISFFSSCSAGYVTDVPIYVETTRPMRPNASYIWIEGDWRWNNQTRNYYHENGRWVAPNRGKNYKQGHWNQSPRGHKWVKVRR